jgi:hypothetical protein
LSYKKDYPNYGNIFSDKLPSKKTRLKMPPILRKKRNSQKKKIIPKKAKEAKKVSLPLQKAFNEKKLRPLKKDLSYGTGISINSSFSTAQNMGYTNSNCENKFRSKRGILTVEHKKMFSKFSQKNISIGNKINQTRNCDSERGPKEEKVLYLADQPQRQNYDTQKLIETIEYDKKYEAKSVKKKQRKGSKKVYEQKKKKISLKQSFESDKERGFKPKQSSKMKIGNDNTFSFNNLSESKFSSMKKPVKKVKRPSRLVSDNKNNKEIRNVFKDDEEIYKGSQFSEGKKKKNGLLEKNIFHLM